MISLASHFWGAHATRVLIAAPSPQYLLAEKFAIARAQSPAREVRTLPR